MKGEHMNKFGKFVAGLIMGGVLGGLLGLLLTPESGPEMRTRIKDNIYYVKNEVKSAVETRGAELRQELAELQKKV